MQTRQSLLDEAQSIIDRAKRAGRPMTDPERNTVQKNISDVQTIDRNAADEAVDAEIRRRINLALRDDSTPRSARRADSPRSRRPTP
jgi:hypothetical protein